MLTWRFLPAGIAGGGPAPSASRRTSAPAVAAIRSAPPAPALPSPSSRQTERAREMLAKGVASQAKTDYLQEESPRNIIHIIRLVLSCPALAPALTLPQALRCPQP